MRTKRHRTWLVLLAVLALALAACGGDDGDGSSDTPTDGDTAADGATEGETDGTTGGASGEIEVWIMQPGSEELEGVIQGTADAFMEENPDATVNIQFVPWASAHDQFVTAVGGGQVPDLAEMGTTWTPEFAALGALAPIEGEVSGDYVESLVDSATVDGEVYGRPWYAGARAFIYRTDVLEEVGAEVPQTWDELTEVGQQIADQTDMYPFAVPGNNRHQVLPMVWQAGGQIAEQTGDGWTSTMDSEEAVTAYEQYGEWWDMGWSPEGALQWNSSDARSAFANGDFAMMVGGSWDYNAILDTNPELEGKLGVALLPAGPGDNRDTFAGGSHLVTFAESDNQELANQFAEFMLQPDQVTQFTNQIGFLPGTTSGIEASDIYTNETTRPFGEQMIEHSATYPPVPEWGAFEGEQLFVGAAQRVMGGEASAQEALEEVAQRMNEEFDAN